MTYAEEDEVRAGRSPGRVIVAVVLVIIAILLLIAAIIYFTTDAKSLPSIMGQIKFTGHNLKRSNSPRTLRGVVTLIVGLIALAAGVFAFVWKPKAR